MLRRILIIVILLVAGAAGAWAWFALPPRVAIATSAEGPALEAVYATGAVEPVNWARVGPATRARVTQVLVEEGARVTEGQTMARLDDRQARSLADEAEARARFAVEDLNRTRTLVSRDIAARATLERAERDARAARALADLAIQRLDDFLVRAPTDGVVLRRDVEVGEVVDTPASLFWVGEPRPLRVSAEVDEEDIARIVATYRKFELVEKYASVVSIDKLEEEGFNLNLPRYVDTFEAEKPIDLAAVQKDIARLESELAVVRGKMHAHLAALGLGGKS